MKKLINGKNVDDQDMDKFLLEKKGIDAFFVSGIGIKNCRKRNERVFQLKVLIPKLDVEAFQTFALYLMLTYKSPVKDRKPPISRWLLDLIGTIIKDLVEKKDPMWIEARNLLRDYKLQHHKKLFEQNSKNQ